MGCERFLSTPSSRRATVLPEQCARHHQNFYPRPPRGGRRSRSSFRSRPAAYFYPRPPRGGRHRVDCVDLVAVPISIHALLAEGDEPFIVQITASSLFLSTPSSRRATIRPPAPCCPGRYFYPRPPRGRRLTKPYTRSIIDAISIHALLAEGDPGRSREPPAYRISIHALLAEGDSKNREKNILLLSHYTPLCTNCKEMLAKQTAKSHRYLRKRLVFRCEASRKTMCAADSHWPDIKRSARCLGQTPGAVQRARPWSGSCCPAGRTADCPRQGRSGRSALL